MMAPAVTPTGEQIAAAAKRYDGQGYVYGGPGWPPGNWDCSSFVSAVLGHDLGIGLPGGQWGGPGMPPAVHGPVVLDYVTWSGADPVGAGETAPGDLVCWPGLGTGGHIGIVQGPDQMTSALDPLIRGVADTGTATTPIKGFGPTDSFVFRRVKGTGETPAATTAAGGRWSDMIVPLLAGAAVGVGVATLAAVAVLSMGAVLLWAAVHTARAVT